MWSRVRRQSASPAATRKPRPGGSARTNKLNVAIMPGGLLTDLYELNMAASYLRRSMTGQLPVSRW